jgi:hypothetical protein
LDIAQTSILAQVVWLYSVLHVHNLGAIYQTIGEMIQNIKVILMSMGNRFMIIS